MTTHLIETTGLGKSFRRRRALSDVAFHLPAGQIMGLVGQNGSGKTTLLRLVAGFLRPTAGRLRVHGLDPWRHRERVMAHTRFAFAPPALYPNLTARETLRALCALRARGAVSPSARDIDGALDTVGLRDRADDRVAVYSFGMRQRLALAQALLPVPKLLVLDEPADGLDPLALLELRAALKRLRDELDVTILLSSHLLADAETLMDSLLVLHDGCVLLHGTPAGLLADGRELCLAVGGTGDATSRARAALAAAGIRSEQRNGRLFAPAGSVDLSRAVDLLAPHAIHLREFHEQRPTLEHAVMQRLRAAGAGSRHP